MYYKYIHLFWVKENKFSLRIIDAINDPNNGFDPKEHAFIINDFDLYEQTKAYDNIFLFENGLGKNAKTVNYYGNFCDYLVLHSGLDFYQIFRIRLRIAKKIIWRTWGHDVLQIKFKKSFLKFIIAKIVNYLNNQKVKRFNCIGIANTVDIVSLNQTYINLPPIKYLPYVVKGNEKIYESEKRLRIEPSENCRILLGHSGRENDNHIEILRRLEKYQYNNIQIYILLNYGNSEYINEVLDFVKSSCLKNKITVITEFLEYKDYLHLIHSIDIGILDGSKSYALGNISALLYFHKKIYLNKHGLIAQTFDKLQLPYEDTNHIGNYSYIDFSKPFGDYKNDCDLLPFSYSHSIECLHEIFQ
jgi:hypothetical protein